MRTSLLNEIVIMAAGTIRAQKMRSGLTILGIVIGITSMVGMTSLILGFDATLRDSIRELGPDTIFVAQFSGLSVMSGAEFQALLDRPTLTPADARAIERQASETVGRVTIAVGEGGPGSIRSRVSYDGEQTLPLAIVGAMNDYPDVFSLTLDTGRFFTEGEVSHRRRVVVLGQGPYEGLFPNVDPLGKTVRVDNHPFTVIGIIGPRASFGGLDAGQDDIAIIPHTVYQQQYGVQLERSRRGRLQNLLIAVVPREGVTRDAAMRDVTEVMRIRHDLRLDEANDFDLITQDAALRLWEQVSSAVFLALVSISSIALLVGGIGVMAIMTIFGQGADARDWYAEGDRRPPAGDPLAVPPRGGVPDGDRRCVRHPLRQRHRHQRELRHRFPGCPTLVVVRPGNQLLGDRRDCLRHRAGGASLRSRPDRGAPLRVAAREPRAAPLTGKSGTMAVSPGGPGAAGRRNGSDESLRRIGHPQCRRGGSQRLRQDAADFGDPVRREGDKPPRHGRTRETRSPTLTRRRWRASIRCRPLRRSSNGTARRST